jgi:hypothetical protein
MTELYGWNEEFDIDPIQPPRPSAAPANMRSNGLSHRTRNTTFGLAALKAMIGPSQRS